MTAFSSKAASGPKSTSPILRPPPAWPPMVMIRCWPLRAASVAGVRLHAHVIAQRAALKHVVPGGDGERGNLDVGVVLLDGPLLPVAVVERMGEPVEEIGRRAWVSAGASLRTDVEVEEGILVQRQNGAADDARWSFRGWRG